MRAALVVGDSVNFVHDDGVYTSQVLAALVRCEQNVKRLWGGHQDMRGRLEHGAALCRRRVACSDSGAHGRTQIATFQRQLLNLTQRDFQVFLDVV